MDTKFGAVHRAVLMLDNFKCPLPPQLRAQFNNAPHRLTFMTLYMHCILKIFHWTKISPNPPCIIESLSMHTLIEWSCWPDSPAPPPSPIQEGDVKIWPPILLIRSGLTHLQNIDPLHVLTGIQSTYSFLPIDGLI